MFHKTIFKDAQWIMPSTDVDSAIFRKTFIYDGEQKAVITITGLGYFILYINGIKVSDDLFTPAYSDYHPRDTAKFRYPIHDTMNHRIYCLRYDISKYMNIGENCIGIILGSGYYNQTKRLGEGNVTYGRIKLCFHLHLGNTDICSDQSVVFKQGFIKSSNLFYGEEHDYTGFDYMWNTLNAETAGWTQSICCPAPQSDYHIQDFNSDRIIKEIKPKLISKINGCYLYDAGINITGYPVINCPDKNKTVIVECAECIDDNNNLDFISMGGAKGQKCTMKYITDGITQNYHPFFTWQGFRYFTVTDNASCETCHVIHTDVAVTSSFSCNNRILNWYYKAYIQSQLTNLHGCVPSDCPHRERLGYTGDGQLCCRSAMYCLEMKDIYRKWMEDISDCQDINNGHVQHTAPFNGGGGGPSGWGGAIVVVPYEYYMHYKDTSVLTRFLPKMMRYFSYMESRCENGLVVREEEKGWCLGEWCTPEPAYIPESFVNTAIFIKLLMMAKDAAKILKKDFEYDSIQKMICRHTEAFENAFMSKLEHTFIFGQQGADAFAYNISLGDNRTLENIKTRYESLLTYDTGIFGTYILNSVLFDNGLSDLAFRLLTNKKTASFYNMMKNNATTLWERWNGDSNNHPMFGASVRFLFEHILGIRQKEGSAGFDEIVISPKKIKGLNKAKGHITCDHGVISVSYNTIDESRNFVIEIPKNVTAVFEYEANIIQLKCGKNTIRV
ncbi:MAG: family 78 glycoside hydrolase catalytic domain [Clostridia bacterium]